MKRQWETEELMEHWTLDVEDRTLLGNKTGATRLGFAVLLKFFRQEGRFPQHKNEVPSMVITFVATQVGVDASVYLQYAWQGRTIEYHRAQIREALGFRESSVADGEQMQQWLITEVLLQEHQEERLREQVYTWFRRMHLEAPTPDRLTRLIRSATHTFEQQFYEAALARRPVSKRLGLPVPCPLTSGGFSCSPGSKSRVSMMPCSSRTQSMRIGSLSRSIQNFRWPTRNKSMIRLWDAFLFSKKERAAYEPGLLPHQLLCGW